MLAFEAMFRCHPDPRLDWIRDAKSIDRLLGPERMVLPEYGHDVLRLTRSVRGSTMLDPLELGLVRAQSEFRDLADGPRRRPSLRLRLLLWRLRRRNRLGVQAPRDSNPHVSEEEHAP